MVGTRTNIVTSVEVTESGTHDIQPFRPLVEGTAKRFDVQRVSADKAYSSARTLAQVEALGAQPLIPFKLNAKGTKPNRFGSDTQKDVWARMFHYFMYNRDEFLSLYHRRANVETTFSMIKAKFGAAISSRTYNAQVNEVLCKVLCHNLCCLVQSIYELGVDPVFWAASQALGSGILALRIVRLGIPSRINNPKRTLNELVSSFG